MFKREIMWWRKAVWRRDRCEKKDRPWDDCVTKKLTKTVSFSQTEVVLLYMKSASSLLWSSSPLPHLSSSAITCCSGSFGYASNPTSSLFLYFSGFWKSWIIDMQTNVNILYASLGHFEKHEVYSFGFLVLGLIERFSDWLVLSMEIIDFWLW